MQTNEIPIYEVLTFGGPRVGKATLLASMLQDSIRAILHDRLALKITPDEKGEAALNKTARALRIGYEMEGERTIFEQVPLLAVPSTTGSTSAVADSRLELLYISTILKGNIRLTWTRY